MEWATSSEPVPRGSRDAGYPELCVFTTTASTSHGYPPHRAIAIPVAAPASCCCPLSSPASPLPSLSRPTPVLRSPTLLAVHLTRPHQAHCRHSVLEDAASAVHIVRSDHVRSDGRIFLLAERGKGKMGPKRQRNGRATSASSFLHSTQCIA